MNKKLMVMTVAAAVAFAAQAAKELVDGSTWSYVISDGAATITDISTEVTDVDIPRFLGG